VLPGAYSFIPAAPFVFVESLCMEAKLIQIPPQTVDDFAEAQKAHELAAPAERRYQKLYGELKALTAAVDPAGEFLATGTRYKIRISPCGMDRRVDIPKARKRLGAAAFLEACTMTLKALGFFLPAPEVEDCVIVSQTGARSYTAEAIPPVS
jgi:hypothetical protein